MAPTPVVAVSYAADEEQRRIIADVLGGEAEVVQLPQLPPEQRPDALRRARALLGLNLGRELPLGALARAPELEFVQLLSAGADSVDFAALPPDLVLASNVGAYARPMAEHVAAMALALARRLPRHHQELAAGEFNQREPLRTLDGAVCAILGYGGIGAATATLMRALGARIHAVNTSGATSDPVEFAGTLADLPAVLAAADVLVIALPLNSATRGLIGAAELALLKPDAIIVNVARGAIVDERALYEHLRDHPEAGAGIDAWWHEPRGGAPFRTGYPFFELPNVVGSPHNSALVPGSLPGAVRRAAENVLRHLRAEPVRGVVRRADYA